MGVVYVVGSGDCGQLGLGEDVTGCMIPKLHPFFANKDIIDISAGGLHTLALTSSGEVFSWGCNDDYALGHCEPEYTVGKVPLSEPIQKIACGDSISVAVSQTGNIYTWGTFRDTSGVLGHSKTSRAEKQPKRLASLSSPAGLSVGPNHVMVLGNTGRIYSWGVGQQGQLGRRLSERHRLDGLQPMCVTPSSLKAVAVSCGSYHSFCLSGGGKLFSCGLNNFGQLAQGDHLDRRNFTLVNEDWISSLGTETQIVAISCGEHHTVFLDNKGDVHTVGRGDYGQLGIPRETADSGRLFRTIPIKIGLSKIRGISSGGNHVIAVDVDGAVYAWGYGEMGQLGQGREEDLFVPQKLGLSGIIKVSCGGQHSVFLAEGK